VCRIAALHPDQTVLIASHAAAIRSFWGIVAKIAPEDLNDAINYPLNASCTTVIYDGETLVPASYSDAHYFDEIERHGA
jgi:broad specificity phosphatase PhoE